MKYKLLKLPDIKAGTIINNFTINNYQQKIYSINGYSWNEIDMLNNPDCFAPYLFTTKDGVDIFKGDSVVAVFDDKIVDDYNINEYPIMSNFQYFSTKEAAKQYLESLKPQFKVGDVVLVKPSNTIATILKIHTNYVELDSEYLSQQAFSNLRLADKSEIIKYYEYKDWIIENYPKSWEDLDIINISHYDYNSNCILGIKGRDDNRDLFATEKQLKSALAFAQLTQLHAKTIKIYNKINDCDWKPDWNNDGKRKWTVERFEDKLKVDFQLSAYLPLVFPNEKLAEFALKNWENLWKEYYELND